MESPFACATTAFADGHLVTVAGEVDIATAPQLAETLADAANGGTVRVDISGVTFLDSSGLHALVAAHRYITRNGNTDLRSTAPQELRLRLPKPSHLPILG